MRTKIAGLGTISYSSRLQTQVICVQDTEAETIFLPTILMYNNIYSLLFTTMVGDFMGQQGAEYQTITNGGAMPHT
jgi:hypothetical protein